MTTIYIFIPNQSISGAGTSARIGAQAIQPDGTLKFSWDESLTDYTFDLSFKLDGSEKAQFQITPTTVGVTGPLNGYRSYAYTIPNDWQGFYALDFTYNGETTVAQIEVNSTGSIENLGLRLKNPPTGIYLVPVLNHNIGQKITLDTREVTGAGAWVVNHDDDQGLATFDNSPDFYTQKVYSDVTIPAYGEYTLAAPLNPNMLFSEEGGGTSIIIEDPDEGGGW